MDNIDRKLLNSIQNGLGIESRPFLILAGEIGITEQEVIHRIKNLKAQRYIRRIGGVFDSKKLGYSSTLCAVNVPEERIEAVSKAINSFNEITHNYIRNHYYNMWFTIITYSNERIEEIISEIKAKTGICNIVSLPATKVFKIKATFNLTRR